MEEYKYKKLIQICRGEDNEIRRKAIRILCCLKLERALVFLVDNFKDDEITTQEIIKSICINLESANKYYRKHIALKIKELRSREVIPLLVKLLSDEDYEVREGASISLDKLNWKPKNDEEDTLHFFAKREWDKIEKIGKESLKLLINALDDSYVYVRRGVIPILGNLRNKNALPALNDALCNDNDSIVREKAKEAIAMISKKQDLTPFFQNLDHPDFNIRLMAIDEQFKLNKDSESLREILHKSLKDDNDLVKKKAAIYVDKKGWKPADDELLVNISLCCSSENNLSTLERIMTELKAIIQVSHSRELILDYSTAIINAIHHFGKNKQKEKMMDSLGDLKDIKNLSNDKEFRTKYGNGLINATLFYGEFEDYDSVEYCLTEIRQMNKEYPEKALRVILGRATVNATLNYGKNKKYNKMNTLIDELRLSYMDFHDKDSAIFYANGLNNSITYFSESSILRDMENVMLEIQTIVRDFNIIEIHREFAKSLISFTKLCFDKKSTKNFDLYLSLLEKIIEENRDIELIISLAKSLSNTISLKGELKEFSKLSLYLKKLEFLYENNKTKEIFIWLANAYQSSISQYCKEEKLKQVKHIKRKFEKIFEKNTINLQVRIEYGKCLYNLQNSFGEKKQFDDMEKIKNEIFQLCTAFTHEGILELKAKSSFMTLVHLSQNNQPLSFSDVLVSFNTRYHLPKEGGQNKDIQQIEQNFIIEIISKIKDIGNNPEEIEYFVSWLSSQIKNVTDKFQVRESVVSILDDEIKALVSKSWLLY